ncbi:MAG: capsule assembly Wzi family protein [Deltaproteobacteria bacterium]|nr:capsule assembly Wzi family protein [Deltaproteobacteria bacterium]
MGGSLSAVLAAFVLFAAPAHAADLFLTGEREVYLAVDKLNAMGQLPGFLANTRPYSVAAVRAALANNAAAGQGTGCDAELARWASYATKPTVLVRGTAALEADEKRETRPIEGGVPTPRGVSTRLSILAREETSPFVSAHASVATFFGEGGETGTRVGETAIETGTPSAALQIGKIATWYGPGRLGALIFTNNAQSYPGIRLHNPVPIAVPGLFSFLGNAQYDLFLARLESDRPIPNPLLFGMRLAARPGRYLELGLSRSMIYGGHGHDSGIVAWWDAFKGENTNEPGDQGLVNQIAGFDITLTLPFPSQPIQAYLEMAGEDAAHLLGTPIPFPSKFAYVTGVFLPTLFGSAAHDLRVEWARNHWQGNGPAWYVHSVSGEGYAHSYRNRVLGHPMGNDAQNLSIQGHHFLLPSTYIEWTLSRTDRFSPGPMKERTDRASAGLVGWLSENVRAEAEIALEKVKNPAGLPGSPAEDASFRVALSYQHGSGK